MRNYLTIAGKDSRDYGVYISGQGTFSAPEKAYEFYNVPGRNGAILGNDHRLENIEVSYECFIYSDFNKNIADFRTFLLSLNGYQKLTDSYHPDEYRMAVYVGPFEPEVTETNDAGTFTLTFNCKPQRWLISGETMFSWVPGGAQTLTGDEITAFVPRLDSYMKASANATYLTKFRAFRDGIQIMEAPASGSFLNPFDDLQNVGSSSIQIDFITGQWYTTPCRKYADSFTMTKVSDVFKIQESATSVQSFYSGTINRFWLSETITRPSLTKPAKYYQKITAGASEAATITALMAQTYAFAIYNDHIYIRDADRESVTAAEFQEYWEEFCLVYYTANSTPINTFTPIDFSAIGEDWSTFYCVVEGVNITPVPFLTMKYSAGDDMRNPTMFPSSPLIKAYGDGSFTMDGVTITIANTTTYTVIDCELMDCYEGSTNRNKDVTFSTYDFPKLQPGDNVISNILGITALEITPRWWRV